MAFAAADSYARFMGRFSEPLAPQFLDFAGVRVGQRVLDVGCGPGALTARLVERLGPDAVGGVDPSESFVAAARARCPGADIRRGTAEQLPFGDASYDVALAQLVVHFLRDPVRGLQEMGRVVGEGTVAACVWNHAGGDGPLTTFWRAVQELDPDVADEAALPGAGEGDLGALARKAGLQEVEEGRLVVSVRYDSFEDWWEPYTLGVGPAGDHVAGLDAAARERLRDRCARLLPAAPFDVTATAWAVRTRG